MTPTEFAARSKAVGIPAAYGEAIGRPDWGEGLARLVPAHMQEGVCRYILFGVKPGHFLSAVLANDLMGALRRADDINISAIPDWARFLYNYAPPGCFGSIDNFAEWKGVLS